MQEGGGGWAARAGSAAASGPASAAVAAAALTTVRRRGVREAVSAVAETALSVLPCRLVTADQVTDAYMPRVDAGAGEPGKVRPLFNHPSAGRRRVRQPFSALSTAAVNSAAVMGAFLPSEPVSFSPSIFTVGVPWTSLLSNLSDISSAQRS